MPGGQDPSKIDLQDIDNWLVSRNANASPCPVCGETDWLPPTRPVALLTITPEGTFHRRNAAVAACYLCRNCAFMRLHAPGILKATQR